MTTTLPGLRFVRAPDGTITPDLAEKLPGRGAWVQANRQAVISAIEQKAFAKAFKKAARLPEGQSAEDFIDRLEALLLRDMSNRFGLARKSGMIICGFEKTRETVKKATASAYIYASDAAADGVTKIIKLAQAVQPDLWCLGGLSRAELGASLGEGDVVHAVLLPSKMTKGIIASTKKIVGFRQGFNRAKDIVTRKQPE